MSFLRPRGHSGGGKAGVKTLTEKEERKRARPQKASPAAALSKASAVSKRAESWTHSLAEAPRSSAPARGGGWLYPGAGARWLAVVAFVAFVVVVVVGGRGGGGGEGGASSSAALAFVIVASSSAVVFLLLLFFLRNSSNTSLLMFGGSWGLLGSPLAPRKVAAVVVALLLLLPPPSSFSLLLFPLSSASSSSSSSSSSPPNLHPTPPSALTIRSRASKPSPASLRHESVAH